MICLVRIAGSIMFVWCNGIYHVCLVYCFDFCSILSYSHYAIYHFMGLYNFRDCLMYRLFGVPFTSVVVILDCVVYHLFVWCTGYVCRGHTRMCGVPCLFGVPFTSVVVILECVAYHVFVWCTVYVCRGHTRLYGVPCVCLVYRFICRSHTRLYGVPCVCLVYRLRLSWSYSIAWCTMCLFGVPFTSVVVILDCVVYHVFGLVHRLRLSWSYSIVWCTMCLVWCTVYVCRGHTQLWGVPCLFGVPFTSVVVTLACVVYHMFVCVPFMFCRGHT